MYFIVFFITYFVVFYRVFCGAFQEAETLEHWAKTDAFQESLRRSKGKKPFAFFDGPPFATGLPHFGHM
jgi:isoleucyl-tRNA synthetase